VTATILDRQFARTPYAVSFQAGAEELTLVTLHVIWGGRRGAACRRASRDRHVARGLAEPREHVEQEPDHTGGLQRQSGGPLRRPHLDRPDHSCGAERVPRTIFESRASSTSTTRSRGSKRTATARSSRSGFSAPAALTLCRFFKAGSPRRSSRGRSRTTTRSGLSSAFRCRPPRITAAARHASSPAPSSLCCSR
jgi:hypothetical protein